jgi:transcriptional regulator with XRE-family HTH domain
VDNLSDRLKWCRKRFGWTQRDLARVSSVGLATIRRIEQQAFEPRLGTVRRLAETLHVRDGWLAFGERPMLEPRHMTADEQHTMQSGLGTDGTPSDGIVGPGPWRQVGDEWRVNRSH